MSIVGKQPGFDGYVREKVDLYRNFFCGNNVTAGIWYAFSGSLSNDPKKADHFIVFGADKRICQVRFAIAPELATGEKLTMYLIRATDKGGTFVQYGSSLDFDGDTAVKKYQKKNYPTPLPLNDEDFLGIAISTNFKINHGFSAAIIVD